MDFLCGPCALGLLVNRPFSNWIKNSNTLPLFSAMADTLKSSVNNPATWFNVMFSDAIQQQINENKQILRQILQVILFLAKQGLSFRGNVEDVTRKGNPGNFLTC